MLQIEVSKNNGKYIFESKKYKMIHESESLETGYAELNSKIENYKNELQKYELEHGEICISENKKIFDKNKIFAMSIYLILLMIISGASFGVAFAKSYRYFVSRGMEITKNFETMSDEEKLKVFEDKLLIIKPFYKKVQEVLNE